MRKLFIFFCLVSTACDAQLKGIFNPINIYVSESTGSFGNNGLTPATAVNTAKFLTLTLADNTNVLFLCGDTFEISDYTVTTKALKISQYGSGANPVIRGSSDIGALSWTNEGSGIYSTTLSTDAKWLFIGGVQQKMAQSAWIPMTGFPSGSVINGSTTTLNAFSSFVGAKCRVKEFQFWLSTEYTVSSYNSGNGNITMDQTVINAGAGYGFLLTGKQFISSNGDWWYDSSTKKIYVKSAASPGGTNIRVAYNDNIFIVSSTSGFNTSGVDYQENFNAAIYSADEATGVSISNCNFHNFRGTPIFLDYNSTAVTISDNTIHDCSFNGMFLGYTHKCIITGNTVYNIDLADNYGWCIGAIRTDVHIDVRDGGAGIMVAGGDFNINHNTVYSTAYVGIFFRGINAVIEKNLVHDVMNRFGDGGCIYMFGSSNCTVQNNICYNSIGSNDGTPLTVPNAMGIYVDNYSTFITVNSNSIYAITNWGILLNWATSNHTVTNNIVQDAQLLVIYAQDTSVPPLTGFTVPTTNVGNTLTGNVLVTKSPTQYAVVAESYNGDASYNPFSSGGSTDNNFYLTPFSTNQCGTQVSSGGAITGFTFANWKTHISGDASTVSHANWLSYVDVPTANTQVKISTNPTDSPATISISAGYFDKNYSSITGATIPVWYSVIYTE